MENGTLLAAVDLGSNSFRLEIGRFDGGHIRRIEYHKETVRQGGGLDAARNLSPEALQRGWDCLARFGERLHGFPGAQVRAVATQTLREARNRDEFLVHAREVLGFPIDVIAGREEARLIYLGVAHLLPQSDERRLVVDIGGRSTELILGHHFSPQETESYRVGSVSWSQRYFPDGEFTEDAFERARVAALAVLDEAQDRYPREGWDRAYGSSGTVGAIADVLTLLGHPPREVNRDGLLELKAMLLSAGSIDRLRIDGLRDDRKPVIGGGLSVLLAVFEVLGIEALEAADGALRHGALFDLLDREDAATDVRGATVSRLVSRFALDAAQAHRVAAVAAQLFGQLPHAKGAEGERHHRKLGWAAQLHEIGTLVSHSNYHKHGAYILDHADAPGFTDAELHRLGQLVLGHRGKLRKLDVDLGEPVLARQLLCLRLAVILCHARRDPVLGGLALQATADGTRLCAPAGWVRRFPQSAHLLREEANAWLKTPWTFSFAQVE